MDHYELFGEHPKTAVKPRKTPHHAVSKQREQSFVFHERLGPPLETCATPNPTSNMMALDKVVAQRFALPLWERAYHVKGRISINARRKHLFVGGDFFAPSTRKKHETRHHNTYQKGLAVFRSYFGNRVVLDQVLWLTHTHQDFYFHTYHDLMTQVALADELGISKDVPIVVDDSWADLPHAKLFLKSNLLCDRQIVRLKPDETLVCKSLYMLQPQHFCRRLLDRVASSFEEERPDKDFSDRLVLIRDKATLLSRSCAGMQDLVQALEAQGFSVLDPALLTMPQQKWVFARASHIVAENGSALTNIVHRGAGDLRIDALMASRFPSTTFQSLSKIYGFDYRAHVLPSTEQGKHVQSELTPDVMKNILKQANQNIRKYA